MVGLQYKDDGEDLKQALGARLSDFGLELHPEKTHLIEFGRFAIGNSQQRGESKPKTFTFLGFTHTCAKRRSDGGFALKRLTNRKKLTTKLKELRVTIMKARFHPVGEQAKWLRSIILGHVNYFGVPGNRRALDIFRKEVCRHWHDALKRRSQKGEKLTWIKMRRLVKATIPKVRIVHPYPSQRFSV